MEINALGDRFSPLGSGNWFVSLCLSPRGMLPCSWRKPLRKTGVELAAPLQLGLLKALRKEGLFSNTWWCTSSPSDKSSLGHQQSLRPQAASLSPELTGPSSPRQKAERPWKPANRVLEITRATFLELFRQSRTTKRFLKGFSPS